MDLGDFSDEEVESHRPESIRPYQFEPLRNQTEQSSNYEEPSSDEESEHDEVEDIDEGRLDNLTRSDRETQLQFYRLPKVIKNQGIECEKLSEERRRLWIASLQQNFSGKNLENIRICSAHFVSGKRAELYQRDNPDWVPTLNMVQKGVEPESTSETLMMSPDMLRFRRRQGRDTRKKTSEAAQSLLLLQEPVSSPSEISEAEFETGIACQTTLTLELLDSMTSDLQNLRTENLELHEQVQKSSYKYEEADFKGKNDKVLYYTGLQSFQILLTLFNYLKPCMPERKSISQFRMLILTLMRLRLNVTASFLAYEFDISSATVSRVFADVIDIMYVRMKPLVFWPSREDLKKTMPMQFRKHFGTKCAVIIDCFEVFIDRPSNLKARAETWSSYKHLD